MRSRVFALGFLFFAYFVWPFLVPVASYLVERKSERRGAFLAFSGFGMLLGLTLFVPLLFDPDSLPLKIVRHSIDYNSQLIWADIVPYVIIRIIYAGIVCIPLLLSSEKQIRVFGAIITLSVILGFVFAHYAFTSVWCFMAAIVSVYLAFVMYGVGKR